MPAVVVEVVDEETRHTDLVEKREEYAAFGVEEYWAMDAERGRVVFYAGRTAATELTPEATIWKAGERFRSAALDGFELDVSAVLSRNTVRART